MGGWLALLSARALGMGAWFSGRSTTESRQDHTDQEPSSDREIEREVLVLNNDIARQTP
jgi:hypothetical protein